MKANEFRELVNSVRNIALKYHDHQSLRERIADRLYPLWAEGEKMKKDNFSSWMGVTEQVIPMKAPGHVSLEERINKMISQEIEQYLESEECQERINAAISDRVSDTLNGIDVESLLKDNLEAWRNANHKSK